MITLRVGKTYRARNGTVHTIRLMWIGETHPYASINNRSSPLRWNSRGYINSAQPDPFDLIEELPQMINVKLGGTYRARNGTAHKITAHHIKTDFPFRNKSGSAWRSDGAFSRNGESPLDLVECITPVAFRKGDKVLIECTVRETISGTVEITLPTGNAHSISASDVFSVTEQAPAPKPFQPGEKLWWIEQGYRNSNRADVEVEFITQCGKNAFVKYANNGFATPLDKLRRPG